MGIRMKAINRKLIEVGVLTLLVSLQNGALAQSTLTVDGTLNATTLTATSSLSSPSATITDVFATTAQIGNVNVSAGSTTKWGMGLGSGSDNTTLYLSQGSCYFYLKQSISNWIRAGSCSSAVEADEVESEKALSQVLQLKAYLDDGNDGDAVPVLDPKEVRDTVPGAVVSADGPQGGKPGIGVNYEALIPLLIEAIKAQQAQIEAQEELIADLVAP